MKRITCKDKELLKKINDAGGGDNHNPKISKSDLVKSCGNVSIRC